MGIIPKELRNSLPVILSQLNSAVVAFVPSENKNNTTSYNFEADLEIDLFSPWDRRSCLQNHKRHEHFHDKSQGRLHSDPAPNHTRNYGFIEVSKIAVKQTPTCYYYIVEKTVKCERELERNIAHEILHFLNDRFPNFSERFFNSKGGYKDRLQIAQSIVPKFGVTKCTPSVWEEHCSDGPISKEEASKIAKLTNIPQGTGSIAGRFYANKIKNRDQTSCYGNAKYVEQGNNKYCIYEEESLYAFVRGGDEYIQTLLEEAIIDPEKFQKVASQEEKKMFAILNKYLF